MSRAVDFQFTSYQYSPSQKRIVFNYRVNFTSGKPLEFSETIILPRVPQAAPKALIDSLLASLHLILGISFYKLYCPKEIAHPYKLKPEQAEFFNIIYKKGLGEFYYRNHLDPGNSPIFASDKKAPAQAVSWPRREKALVGIGGGKDSIVVAELMKQAGQRFSSFVMETEKGSPIINKVIKVLGGDKLIIKRQLDQKIFDKIPGTYNGHIPFNAILAFIGLLGAVLFDYDQIVVGNEYSSNFGNITYKGLEINHQWSKSLEFEQLFQNYCRKFITPDVRYYSLLRPYYEIRIAAMFAKYEKYHHLFSSCNRNFKVDKERQKVLWCGECPKCAFVFSLLAAFLPKEKVIKIFGKNLFADKKLLPLYLDLIGEGKMKPFECIGTFEEIKAAMGLASREFKSDYIIKELNTKIVQAKKYAEQLLRFQDVKNMSVRQRLLGLKNILILGYGKEGKITEKYLKKRYKWLKIGIADQSISRNYLDKQMDFEFAIKTPGIAKGKVTIPYATATNIFFDSVKNPIIGVTGSKGKSTTASLIYAMLRQGGYDAELVGNIGKPMLAELLKPIPKSKIFIAELSSYQLEDIESSPAIAVVTNLFPEHMNYHGGEAPYYNAKKNIIDFQTASDYFIYNADNRRLKRWAKEARSNACGFIEELPVKSGDIPLLGHHNLSNIRAAATVAKLLGISDADIARAIKNFKGLPHRLQYVGEYKKIKFYDDAISTTPESTMMALKSLGKIGTILLGGEDRGYDFRKLEKLIRAKKIKNIVLFPDSGKRIFKSLAGLNILRTRKMQEAVEFAYKFSKKGEICLLSTASPSYSIWKGFEEKGDLFRKWVKFFAK